jgi:hypothetical protein
LVPDRILVAAFARWPVLGELGRDLFEDGFNLGRARVFTYRLPIVAAGKLMGEIVLGNQFPAD